MKGYGKVSKGANPSIKAAAGRNPNKGDHEPNNSPDGPYGPLMNYDGHGGMHGDTTVKGKNGATFNFK